MGEMRRDRHCRARTLKLRSQPGSASGAVLGRVVDLEPGSARALGLLRRERLVEASRGVERC